MTAVTKNDIIEYIVKDPYYLKTVKNILKNNELAGDAFNDIILAIYDHNNSIINIYNKQVINKSNDFNYYFIRICMNQFISCHSKHYKLYIKSNSNLSIEEEYTNQENSANIQNEFFQDTNYENEMDFQDIVNYVNQNMEWWQIEIFNMYFIDHLTMRDIEKATKIPLNRVYRYIDNIRTELQNKFNEEI
jgi:RNA polymerase sigma factor (sigma-70 family)